MTPKSATPIDIRLSYGQRALWFLDRLAPGNAAYIIAGAARVVGPFDPAALRRAVVALASRHPALRSTFKDTEDGPVQRVGPKSLSEHVEIVEEDGAALSASERVERLSEIAFRPFDLATGPLLRVGLLRFRGGPDSEPAEAGYLLSLSVHHIVSDFWSLAVILRDLGALYAAELGETAPLPPLSEIGIAEIVRREEASLAGERGEEIFASWRQALDGFPFVLELPTDRPRPAAQGFRGASLPLHLDPRVADAVRRRTRKRGATLYMGLLAAFDAVLARHSHQEKLLVGCPTTGRGDAALAGLVGYLVNPVPIPGDLSGDPAFGELLARVRAAALGAFGRQAYPFPLLAERLQPERDPSRSPLFQVLLVLQKGRRAEEEGLAALSVGEAGVPLELGGGVLRLESIALDEPGAQLDLQVMLAETAHGIAGRWLYDRDLFEPATMARMAGHFAHLLGFLADADEFATPLSELPLLGAAERAQLTAWADGGILAPGASCLHERVFAQAARTPGEIALWAGERQLTYAELAAGARRIAGHLRSLGVGPEVRVGLCSERTPQMILGLLGILAAGGAYVPLDPAYPAERLAFMLEDSGAALVLVSTGAGGRLPAGTRTVALAEALEEAPAGRAPETWRGPELGNLAYLIYTSGSTGRPKAVAIAHASASALVTWAAGAFSPAELSGVLAATSIAFDLSVFEIFVPLSLGGTVILAENALALPQLPARDAVTLVNTVPSAMAELVRGGALSPSVRTVNLAGEPLPGSLARQIHAAGVGRLLNLYGPSEDTTYSTWAAILPAGSGEPGEPGEPAIGRPLPGGRAYVVDPRQQPAPLGVPGELWLGGAGLARGYLGQPERTAERFVPDPWSGVPGARLYRTGDLVRFRTGDAAGDLAGSLMFLGRLDHQVKVRGFRIELGEVESALVALPGVREAVVLAREEASADNPGKRLVAYVSGDGIDPEGLRAGLAARLPGYLVPSAFVLLPALPLTPNGKADRRALAGVAPEQTAGSGAGYVAPRTATETLLAAIWAEVLHAERVGVTDDFFQLGGHSLLATQVASRVRRAFGVEIAVRRLFEARTVATLALEIEGIQAAADTPSAGVSLEPVSPAREVFLDGRLEAPPSFAQERLWFLDRLEPGTAAYNVPVALWLGGPLEIAALAAALASVVARHEALRTTFIETSGRPVQLIGPVRAAVWNLPVVDLAALPETRREETALTLAGEEAALPFDLERGPLLRSALVRLSPPAARGLREGDHLLLLTLHHIVTDGWSMGVLVREVGEVYGALLAGRPPVLPELPLQYRDYAIWQREWLAGEVLRGQLAWWRERLSGMPPLLDLPTDRPRPAVQGTAGGSLAVALPEGLTASLYQLAEGGISGVSGISGTASLFMVLLAGFQALLARHAGQSRVVVGSPVANRNHRRIEDLIGLFVNTLALPGDLSGDPPFAVLLARARETALGAYSHQELPFEKLVEELSPGRSLAHTPLFQVLLVLQNADMGPPALPGLTATLLDIPSGMEKFDLTLDLQEQAGGLAGKLTYRLDLFDPPTVERLFGHFVHLLAGAVADPAVRLADLPLLSAAERAQLAEWSGTTGTEEREGTLQNPLAVSCARVPERVALVTATAHLSYGELARGARRIASRLHALGAGPEVRIGLASARSEEMVLGLLGILAAGAAYVPLDPAYPAERLALLLADSGAALVLAGRSVLERVPAAARVVLLKDLLAGPHLQADLESSLPVAQPGNLAYLIYTSGSTGRPKAVAIAHASASALVRWAAETFSPEELSGVLAATSIAFDLSVFELFVPLVLGGTVILADNALALPGLPAREAVTLVNTVPSAMAELLRDEALPASVRTVNLAGEPLSGNLARQVAAAGVGRLLNLYGPSEDTTYSTWEAVAATGSREPGIGRPISGGRAYVVDPGLQLAPPGVPGELWLGGAGLARGYLGRPEGTAERFVPDPWSGLPGERLYRTGDLVRFLPEGERMGELMFLGRLDHQVKVRGFRIELGEVEAALAGLPGVREAAVLARDEPGRLIAYVSGDGVDAEGLREQLAASLPGYMVPSVFVLLPALPLTPNGKVDRRALAGVAPEPGAGMGVSSTAPRTATEALLAAIWTEVLGVDRVGMEDDFFLLGGHSLLATQVVSRLRRTLGVEVSVRRLFEARTVAALAREVETAPASAAPAGSAAAVAAGASAGSAASAASAGIPPLLPVPRLPDGTALPLSFAQERLWFLDQLEPGSAAYNMAAGLRLTGRLDLPALSASLGEVVRRHEALRTTFRAGAEGAVQVVGGTVGAVGELPLPRRLPVVDLRGLPAGRRESAARKLLAAAALQPFDLVRGPLVRARLFRLTADEHVLFLCLHHIVADGWSIGLLVREVAALYPAFLAGLPSPLAELPIQYGDFSVWQRRWLSGETLARRVAWWREHLQGIPPLELPTDRLRPAEGFHGGGEMREVAFPTALLAALRTLAAERRGTLFMVLLAGFEALLSRYSGQTDLAVGSVVANRGRVEVEELIGFFVNTLALRARLDGDPAYGEILDRVRETTLAAYAREDVPFELLVEALAPRRDLARTPLFDAVLNVQPAGLTAPLSLPGLDLRPVTLPPGPAKFDLTLNLFESAEGLVGNLAYRPELFDAATIERLAGHFATLLAGAAADPGCRLSRLPLLTAAESQALREGNATAVDYPGDSGGVGTLAARFAAQAEASPDAVALVFDRTALTYGRLAAESRSLARRLRRLGVGPEVPVGICLERSLDLVVGLLAILEAGGAYVPLDPSYPRERLAGMLADAGAPVVLTWRRLQEILPVLPVQAGRTIFLDDPAEPVTGLEPTPVPAGLDNLAYVIFTSGSTGRPKGAMNAHRGIVNRLLWMQETYGLTPADRVLQKTPFSFDVSVWEFFWPLLSGACLVVARPGEHQAPARLARTIVEESVTTLHFVPAMLQAFLEEPSSAHCESVRQVMASGEALPLALQNRFFERLPDAALHNLYGPTEAAVDVSFWACERGSARTAVPIGRPVANTALHLLDAGFEPAPIGVPGELFLGGVQVGRGYFGRPELTAERFVPDPAGEPGARAYRTGDLVRRLPAGEVEFLGRIDHQVKIRGLRIELGEIESALARHPAVQEAVVLAEASLSGESADRRLVAYVVPEARRAAPLRARLRLEREGRLTATDLHELPNGMAVAHRNRGETEFLYREIFVDEGYLRHGIAVADGDTIFDVGANIGLFALFAGRRARGVRIFAFEPIPEVFAALRLNAALHGLDARLFDCGVAEAAGTAEFTYYPHATLISGRFADGAEEREVVRSFVESQVDAAAADLGADRLEEMLTERLEARQVVCELRALSEVIAAEGVARIDLLKIDVEKSELSVLAGLAEEDWAKVRQVVLEVHDVEGRLAQVLALLERHGFEVAAEQDLELSGTALYNLYARRPAAAGESRVATPPEPAWESAGALVADVTAALRAELPEFMVPAAFTVLEAFPLSPSGKVDRRALLSSNFAAALVQGARKAPSRPMEKLLAGLWAELLRRDPEEIGVEDNFFVLGGHSLLGARLLSRLESRLEVEIPLRRLFTSPILADLAREVEAAVEAKGQAVTGAGAAGAAGAGSQLSRPAELPLSFSQERLWFLDQLEPGSAVYNIPALIGLRGELSLGAITAALDGIVRRHEVLRTTFARSASAADRPIQVIAAERRVEIPIVDLAALPEPLRRATAESLTRAEAGRPFDLGAGPLLRALLVRLTPVSAPANVRGEHLALLNLHHIVSDGWSTGVLISELAALYTACLTGQASPLPALPWQYADYALWQRQLLAGPELERQLGWWREHLAGAPEALELPTDRPRPAVQGFRGARLPFVLPANLAAAARRLSEESGASLFMTLLTVFQALLARLCGQDDLTVGSPIAGRRRPEVDGLIGFFVNTLVLRLKLTDRAGLRGLLGRTRESTLGAFENQDVPFERLVEALRPARQLARTPLFQVMFVLQNAPAANLALPGLDLAALPVEIGVARFDLTFVLREDDGRLAGGIEYNRDLFDVPTMARLAAHFETLLAAAVAVPDHAVTELPLLSPAERHQALREWNDRAEEYPREGLVPSLIAAVAGERPDAPALGLDGARMSYRELELRAARIGRHLVAAGVGPDDLVGIAAERSFAMVAALLGIWKAGAAYLPLDVHLPPERLAFLLADGAVEIVLTQESLAPALPAFRGRSLRVEDLWECEPEGARADLSDFPELPDRAAYVIYTSGSTGRPKGVVISHRALGNRLRFAQAVELSPGDSFVQKTTTSFDASVCEIFSPLLTGGTVVLARPGGEREPAYLVDLVRDWRIPHMSFTMAMLGTLLDEQSLAGCDSLRTVLVGGEAMPPDLPARFHAQSAAEIFNRYGPTETTISITSWRPERGCQGRTVPIGRPIARTEIHVLDRALEPVPVGALGELAIGGAGLARGYLARPDVTAERFVPHPWSGEPGARLYLSGDLVRFRPDGALEFLGRTDNQVKIRGFRVELGEIEAALEEHPAVAQVAVVDLPDPGTGSKRLVAYFVPHPEGDLAPRALQDYLATRVPGYMVPALFVRLDAMPLTPTGKTDRQALPEPAAERPTAAWEAPRTPIEEVLAGIWEELLGVRQVDRRDSFFELGGHSLLATRLVSRLREAAAVELPLKAVFEAPTLCGLAELVEAAWRDGGASSTPSARIAPPLRPIPRRRDLPLSFAQERLWFLEQLEPGNASYHLPVAVRFKGRLEAAALGGALAAIVARHEALRTRFVTVEGRPAQAISARVHLGLPSVDLSLLSPDRREEREEEVRRLALEAARQPFDLERGPLLRVRLLRLEEEEHVLLLSMHHIVSDGWSMGVLVRELGVLYRAAVEGRPSPLPALPVQYPDFAVWQREWLSGEVLAAELRWWRERLAGAPAVLQLPTDRPRPAVARFRGAGLPFRLSAAVTAGLQALCRRRGVTPFMALLAGFSALLWRGSGQDDLVVGTPIAGRTHREIEGLIGFFVNTLALRTDLSGEPGFAGLLARVREGALAAYAHQDVPFDKLVEILAPERSLAHAPLFQVFLVLQNTPAETLRLPGLELKPVELGTGAAKFDLTLALGAAADGLAGVWEYDRDLFDPPTIARLGGQLERLLEAAVAEPEARIGALALLSAAERQQLAEWNGTAAPYREVSLSELITEQAARTPDAAAVVFEDEVLSYGGLAARAGRLAGELRRLGVGPEVRVGICAERSLGLLVGLVAILEAGGAYVPLDPSYPADRLAFMLEDSGVPVLLTEGSLAAALPGLRVDGIEVVRLDRAFPASGDAVLSAGPAPSGAPRGQSPVRGEKRRPRSGQVDPDQLAYVIYTSGSTGRPKGAMNAHRGIVNRLLWMRERYAVGPGDRVLQKTPVSFDVSVWELFIPLVTGACLVVARPGGHQDPAYLVETIARQAITLLHFVPAMLSAFLEAPGVESCTAVRQVIASGEALPSDLERRFFSKLPARLDNLYGPTEAAVEVTFWACDREGTAGRVPIGRPVANTAIHLLGRDLRPVPPGGSGELAIAGVQVGRGYLNRPELTAERFLPDPFAGRPGARLYLTGDLARHLPDGPIEYLGRIDHQVKLRGFRIELGEIESALLGHPGVRDAAAMVRPMRDGAPGDLLLVAYVVPERPPERVEELEGSLRSFLGERLPAHMLPAVFVFLQHLPLTPNGKVDRRALPAPDWRAGSSYVAPRTPLEEVLASFFAEILGLERVGVEDGFFKLGGHSLLAAQLVAKVRGAFQVDLPLRRLFETPTVSAVAAAVAAAEGKPGQSDKVARILLRVHRMAAEKRLTLPPGRSAIG